MFVEALGDNPLLVTDDALGGMATELMPHSGIVTGGGGHAAWGARVSVEAGSAVQAVTRAAAIVAWSAAKTGLPAWPVVRAEATREDVLNLELSA